MDNMAREIFDRMELLVEDWEKARVVDDASYDANTISSGETEFFGRKGHYYNLYFPDGSRFSYTEFSDDREPRFGNLSAT